MRAIRHNVLRYTPFQLRSWQNRTRLLYLGSQVCKPDRSPDFVILVRLAECIYTPHSLRRQQQLLLDAGVDIGMSELPTQHTRHANLRHCGLELRRVRRMTAISDSCSISSCRAYF